MNSDIHLFTDPYRLFRHLIASLDLRSRGRGRDQILYQKLRAKLQMGNVPPRVFFIMDRRVTPQVVLQAFLTVLQPFIKMVNEIYRILTVYKTTATGGNDFALLYDDTMKSLSFDLAQFKRFAKLYREITGKRYVVRFHSDFVPGFEASIQEIYLGRSIQWPPEAEPQGPLELQDALSKLQRLAEAHQQVLQKVIADWRAADGHITKTILAERYGASSADWFEEFSRGRVDEWAKRVEYAVHHIPLINVERYCRTRSPKEIGVAVANLRRILHECGPEEIKDSLEKAQQEFLELPYWKKRWQVFEVWVVMTVAQRICPPPRGKANLVGGQERILILRTGESKTPKFIWELNHQERVEIWLEHVLTPKDRPDIAVIRETRGQRILKALIECKQRESEDDRHYLSVAERYANGCPEGALNCIVNYDAFMGPQLRGGDEGVCTTGKVSTLFLDKVSPGTSAAKRFQEYLETLSPSACRLIFLIDNTLSMRSYRASILIALWGIIEGFQQKGAALITAFLYGDHCDAPDRLIHCIPWSDNGEEIVSKIQAAEEADGGDRPEALEDALHEAIKSLKEVGSTAHLFVFTDAPPHEVGDCPNGLDFDEQVGSLLEIGVQITLVACGGNRDPWKDLGWDKFKSEALVQLVQLKDIHRSL
ncbi:MAG: hypothetical protein LZF62_480224 [Nitrospira sp.]|nr:MAG: hypothetical protein LZF62_480224 [Nitrospira sp.]